MKVFRLQINDKIFYLSASYDLLFEGNNSIELITFFRKSVVAWGKVLSTEINPVVWSR